MATSQDSSLTTGAAAASAGEQRAREFLAAGRFRKARDEIKLLCKVDRARYLPLLIEANKGLAREMLGKGLVSEAQQVVAYLKTIASPAEVRALELETAANANNPQAVLSTALPLLTDSTVALGEAEKRRLADHLVLAFQPIPANGAAPALAAEIRTIHQAFEAISNQQFERAQELLRPLPHGSLVSQWKLFLRGLIAFYSGDHDKAARFFAGLPPDSAAARASQPYLLLVGKRQAAAPDQRPPAALIERACRAAGLSGLGPVLARAEQQWREGRHAGSYKTMRETLGSFPSENADALGALSQFYFNASFTLPREAAEEYQFFFEDPQYRCKNALEGALIARMLALHDESWANPARLEIYWGAFLQAYEQSHQPNPKLASLVYSRLGAAAAAPRAFSSFCNHPLGGVPDSQRAIAVLQKSIALDPSNLDAHLTLCRVFEKLRLSSQRNRLLDEMTERFPANKAVLIQAARGCLDRQAYVKGLDYLASARDLDRLDPFIPELTMFANIKLGQQSYEKKRLEKARQAFLKVAEDVVDDPMDLTRARWVVLTQQGLLEHLYGERDHAGELLVQARSASPAAVAFLFYAHLAHFDLDRSAPPFPFAAELEACSKEASAGCANLLLRIYNYWLAVPDLPKRGVAETFLRQYLQKAVKKPFTLAEGRALVEQGRSDSAFKAELYRFVERALKQDKQEPFFRLSRYLLKPPSFRMPLFGKPETDPALELSSIIEEAARRGDEKTAQFTRQLLQQLQLPAPRPLPEPAEFEDEVLPDAGMDANEADQMHISEIIASALSNASAAQIDEVRRRLKKDIPAEVVDALIAVARSRMPVLPPEPGSCPSGPAPAGSDPAKPQRSKPDPNQLEFF